MTKKQRKIYDRSIKAHDRYMLQAKPRKSRGHYFFAEGWWRLVEKTFSKPSSISSGRVHS